MKRYTPFLLLTIFLLLPLHGVSIENDTLKISADENSGGFLIYSRVAPGSSWVPLLVESYTSSYLEISLDGEKRLLAGSSIYSMRYEQGISWISLIYEDDALKIEERLEFKESREGVPYILWNLEIDNNSRDRVDLGVKQVWDTAFIRDKSHYTVAGLSIEEETAYEGSRIPEKILSRGERTEEKLYVLTAGDGSGAIPDRLLLANWNRLDTAGWDYYPPAGTNFNALPFSINDSALGFYWEPDSLGKGETFTASLALGGQDFRPFTGKKVVYEEELVEVPADPDWDPSLTLLHLEEQLGYLDRLLKEIDLLLESGQELSNDDILNLEERLEILEQKKREYEELQ